MAQVGMAEVYFRFTFPIEETEEVREVIQARHLEWMKRMVQDLGDRLHSKIPDVFTEAFNEDSN